MKTRVALFSIFKKFHAEICTQFNTSIHILRSDNAKEYFSMPFSPFMSSYGILHQLSSAYTSQHNGVAERKNCHLVETTCTLLIHHKVPQRFWGDVILAAYYLINCMPSSICMIRSPILSYYLINLSFASLLMPFVVSILFIFSLQGKTNSQSKPQSVSPWVILDFRGVIIVILPTLITTLSLPMSPSLRIPPSFPLQDVLLFQMFYLFLLSYRL